MLVLPLRQRGDHGQGRLERAAHGLRECEILADAPELAAAHDIDNHMRSSFTTEPGTGFRRRPCSSHPEASAQPTASGRRCAGPPGPTRSRSSGLSAVGATVSNEFGSVSVVGAGVALRTDLTAPLWGPPQAP
jgi:hypothetical protein